MNFNTTVVLTGAILLGVLCGSVGTLAMLRRRALLSDAMSHAALPGIGLAFLITRSKELPVLLLGALVTALMGTWLVARLRADGRTTDDTALALVLSGFFGIGIAISRTIQNSIQDGSQAGLDSYFLGRISGMLLGDVITVAAVSAVALVILAILFRWIQAVAFDAAFSRTVIRPALAIDFLTMALVVVTVVIALPMTGIVLGAALTIIPAAAARFWSDRLVPMIVLAGLFGGGAAAVGASASAVVTDLPTGPAIILSAGVLFIVSLLIAPLKGALALEKARRERQREDARQLGQELLKNVSPQEDRESWLIQQGVPPRIARELR